MAKSAEKPSGNLSKMPLRKRLQLAGGATLGVLAILAPAGCGNTGNGAKKGGLQSKSDALSQRHYNARTESALRRNIRPAMAAAGERIITFAGEHPELSSRSVGKHAVYLTVTKNIRFKTPEGGQGITTDIMRMSVPRTSGNKISSPDNTLAISVSRFSRSPDDPSNNFISAIDLYAPGGAELPVGEGNLHTGGWAAQERLLVGPAAGPGVEPLYDTSGIQAQGGKTAADPLAAARRVAQDMPALIGFTESDLASAGRSDYGRMMP